ncbi:MAG: pacearchaeosortase [Nanoarchaeota archaeon]
MNISYLREVLLRYLILLILGIGNLFIFYTVFTPLTVYPILTVLDNMYGAELLRGDITKACDLLTNINAPSFITNAACMNTTIFFKGYFASIIPACIAGSAYYLLLILNLTTSMEKRKRFYNIIFIIFSFLLLNIIRIITFAVIFANKGFEIFNLAHAATWYFGSTILVILIWFSSVMLFKIKAIPIYTDVKTIINQIRKKQ